MSRVPPAWPPESWGPFVDAVFGDPRRVPAVGSRRRALLDGLARLSKELAVEAGIVAEPIVWDPLAFVVRVLYPEASERAGTPLLLSPLDELDYLGEMRDMSVRGHTTEPAMVTLDETSTEFAQNTVLPALFDTAAPESKGTEEPMEVTPTKTGAPVEDDPVSIAALGGGGGDDKGLLQRVASEVLCLSEMLTLPQVVPCEDGVEGQDGDAVAMVQAALTDLFSILAARAARFSDPLIALAFAELLPFVKHIMSVEARDRLGAVLGDVDARASRLARAALVES